jgi:uncharacterized protein (TIGR01777 family)
MFIKRAMEKVLITGGTGLVGRHLCRLLSDKGYDIAILSRSGSRNTPAEFPTYHWDIDKNEVDQEAINTCDHMIHLAGVNIGEKRWTRHQKEEILNSRIKSANLIFNNLNIQNTRLKTFISASATGYYGSATSGKIHVETDQPEDSFLGEICRLWEQSADQFKNPALRVVKIRTGIVLSKNGGALSRFKIPAKLGLGSALGRGKQYLPWIHMDDLCNIYLKAIEDKNMAGSYNAVAPEHVTNAEFAKKIAQLINKPFWFPNIPSILIKLVFGEMSVMLLNGNRVSSKKIEATGYQFFFPDIDSALKDLNT